MEKRVEIWIVGETTPVVLDVDEKDIDRWKSTKLIDLPFLVVDFNSLRKLVIHDHE